MTASASNGPRYGLMDPVTCAAFSPQGISRLVSYRPRGYRLVTRMQHDGTAAAAATDAAAAAGAELLRRLGELGELDPAALGTLSLPQLEQARCATRGLLESIEAQIRARRASSEDVEMSELGSQADPDVASTSLTATVVVARLSVLAGAVCLQLLTGDDARDMPTPTSPLTRQQAAARAEAEWLAARANAVRASVIVEAGGTARLELRVEARRSKTPCAIATSPHS